MPHIGTANRGQSRFRLLRHFSILSFVAIAIVTAGLVVLYRHIAVGQMIDVEERQNVALTRTFANSILPQFSPYLATLAGKSGDAIRRQPQTAMLDRAVREMMRGLTLTRGFVELHGGELAISSKVGGGTAVTVDFPAERSVKATRTRKAKPACGARPARGSRIIGQAMIGADRAAEPV